MSGASDGVESDRSGFSPLVVLALILVGVFATAAFLVISAYAPELRLAVSGQASAISKSAAGYAGAVRLLDLMGEPVTINRSVLTRNAYPGLMVLTPAKPGQLNGLNPAGDRLIVLPKWRPIADPDRPGWAADLAPMTPAEAGAVLPARLGRIEVRRRKGAAAARLSSDFALWPSDGQPTGPVEGLQTFSGGALQPLIRDEEGHTVLAVAPGGHVYVLSDPDLINTRGLADPRTARTATLILLALSDGQNPLAFDITLNGGGGNHSLLKLALEPPFLGATLCLLIVAGLVGAQAWARFGPVLQRARAVALGKTALVENGAGMARLARREPHMTRRYIQLCRQRAAVALGAGRLLDGELDDFLDRWAERVGAPDRITALTAEGRAMKTVAELTALAARARRWRLEMTREPG